jgi:hypothetical protein
MSEPKLNLTEAATQIEMNALTIKIRLSSIADCFVGAPKCDQEPNSGYPGILGVMDRALNQQAETLAVLNSLEALVGKQGNTGVGSAKSPLMGPTGPVRGY